MKQFDKRIEHWSASKDAKKKKIVYDHNASPVVGRAVLDDSSSDDDDYMYQEKQAKKSAMITPVKNNNVFGQLLKKMQSSASKDYARNEKIE